MARTGRTAHHRLDVLERELRDRFLGTPFTDIGRHLLDQIPVYRELSSLPQMATPIQQFIQAAGAAMRIIPDPRSLSDRFWLDMCSIQALSTSWNTRKAGLPHTLIARTGDTWNTAILHLPSADPERIPRIHLITFPGGNSAEEINLLGYSWLLHELGHVFLFLHDQEFVTDIASHIRRRVDQWAHQLVGCSRAAEQRISRRIQLVKTRWSATVKHDDWPHEIAADTIALWSCGPAFIASYLDSLEGQDPFLADATHPPYHLRSLALLESASRLGWRDKAEPVSALLDIWSAQKESTGIDNEYAAFSDPDIIDKVVSCSLDLCDRYGLPRCDSTRLDIVKRRLSASDLLDPGLDIILGAAIQYERLPISQYHEWESAMVLRLAARVTREHQ